jgi:hypothetical protein
LHIHNNSASIQASELLPKPTSDERTWAALAHASIILTALIGILTAGIGGLFFVLVPFSIYLAHKDRSSYVAYHALQAIALQLLATLGWIPLMLAAVIIMILIWLITALLIVILIGLILIPVSVLLTILLVLLIVVVYPLLVTCLGILGAVQSLNGSEFSYPFIGRWVRQWMDRQIHPPVSASG